MNPLEQRIKDQIRTSGPITVAEYMTLCLLDPVHGYYPTRDPLGSDGDFITAPEISQMFGEVLGLWVLQCWKDLGSPKTVTLVELGPGRGIMMSDIMRAARLDPDFQKAVNVVLIEASPALEAVQGQTLGRFNVPVSWAADLKSLPKTPTIILGNEFLDCLPIRQLIQKDRFAGAGGWHERMVMLDDDRLSFGAAPEPISPLLQAALPADHKDAKNGDLMEICPAAHQTLDQINSHFENHPGRALFIDYGPAETEFGDTLQALKRHEKVGVFSAPGNTDLTARVDFSALSEFAQSIDLRFAPAVTQSEFLSKLGIEIRALTLAKSKPDAKPKLSRQLERLMAPEQMGTLFKAVCFQSAGLPVPLGFTDIS